MLKPPKITLLLTILESAAAMLTMANLVLSIEAVHQKLDTRVPT